MSSTRLSSPLSCKSQGFLEAVGGCVLFHESTAYLWVFTNQGMGLFITMVINTLICAGVLKLLLHAADFCFVAVPTYPKT